MDSDTELPPITVAIPTYNQQHFLPETIECVLHQTYRGLLKILVLNDGSTDDSLAVARRLALQHDNIRVETQENHGRAITRDRLLHLADTALIAWIDGDDLASPYWIEQQFDAMMDLDDDSGNCAAVGGQGYAMTAGRFALGPIQTHPLAHEDIDARHIAGHANAFFQSCVLTRRDVLIRAGGYRAKFAVAEDFDLWLRLAEIGTLRNLPQTHLYYRVHGASANWVANVDQRQQGHASMNDARQRRGLPKLDNPPAEIPAAEKDDWNRRIYWINIAARSGNPMTALGITLTALRRHRRSLLLIVAVPITACDALLLCGNRTRRIQPGQKAVIGSLPRVSLFRLARYLVRLRRKTAR